MRNNAPYDPRSTLHIDTRSPSSGRTSTVFVVDDDDATVESLRVLLESVGYRVRGYASPKKFIAELDAPNNCCLVLDERMPEMRGHALRSEIRRRGFDIPTILYTAYANVDYAVGEMRNGAFMVLQKPVPERILLDAISDALRQDATVHERRRQRQAFERRCAKLTVRQRQILEFVVRGTPSRAIAEHLAVSTRTIELHRSRILRTMHVKTATELAYMVALNRSSSGQPTYR